MIKRIIADIILFLSIFFAPWYIAVGLGVLFVILFHRFWEVLVAGLFLDALYSISDSGLLSRFGIFTFLFLLFLLIVEKIKSNIRL